MKQENERQHYLDFLKRHIHKDSDRQIGIYQTFKNSPYVAQTYRDKIGQRAIINILAVFKEEMERLEIHADDLYKYQRCI